MIDTPYRANPIRRAIGTTALYIVGIPFIVFGMLLIPVSLGRLTLRKPEGLALAILYAVYLVISTALAIRL